MSEYSGGGVMIAAAAARRIVSRAVARMGCVTESGFGCTFTNATAYGFSVRCRDAQGHQQRHRGHAEWMEFPAAPPGSATVRRIRTSAYGWEYRLAVEAPLAPVLTTSFESNNPNTSAGAMGYSSQSAGTSRFRRQRVKSSAGRVALYLAGTIILLATSFSVTLKLIDGSGLWEFNPLWQPAVDIAALPKLAPGHALILSNGENRSALLSGWSYPEPLGTWTEGHAAFLAFIINGTADKRPRDVKLHFTVFVAPPALTEQRVQVWSASDKLADFALRQSQADLLIPLHGFKFDDGAPLVLGFYLPNAASPVSVHVGGDTRILALKISSLELD